ncbi:MAG: putative ABC transporter permease [Lachnospiraceae bacterium]|nr:putative ABC transporter permease [Lachnospiraceae bacterium]
MFHLDDFFVTKERSASAENKTNLPEETSAAHAIDPLNTAHLYCWLFVAGGVSGFIYELFFYRIDLGYFVKRGSTFGPWIPIYAFGAVLIFLLANHFRKHWISVFLLSIAVTGILELGTGWVLHRFFDIRLWDYNTEIWNWGNIGGYICFRSVVLFGFAGLVVIYSVAPTVKKIIDTKFAKVSLILAYALAGLFVLDIIVWHFVRG